MESLKENLYFLNLKKEQSEKKPAEVDVKKLWDNVGSISSTEVVETQEVCGEYKSAA